MKRQPILFSILFTAAGMTAAPAAAQQDIVDTAVAAGQFKTLATALGAAGLVDALKGDGPFTVFAPTDDAFGDVPSRTIKSLLKKSNRDKLTSILTYHVIGGATLDGAAVSKLRSGKTLNGQLLDIRSKNGGITIDGARVVKSVTCSNGIIHVIDKVLMPESKDIASVANAAGKFRTLLAAARAAGVDRKIGKAKAYTAFAPTDEAFAKLGKKTIESLLKPENRSKLTAILQYHVVEGRAFAKDAVQVGSAKTLQGQAVNFDIRDGRLFVNDSAVVANDIDASNGVIHVIDTVLLPPEDSKPRGPKYFGLSYEEPGEALAAQLHVDPDEAIVVSSFAEGSSAKEAGLRRFDVVIKVAGRDASTANLVKAKNERDYGDTVEFEIVRGGKRIKVPVKIGEKRGS